MPAADKDESIIGTRLREGFPHREDASAVARYFGSGTLRMQSGAAIPCRFRADQDADGSIQVVFSSISPIDFANHLLSVVQGGVTAMFRGTTDDGTMVSVKCVGGRALSLGDDGYATIYFTPLTLKSFPAIDTDSECRFLITNFAFSPFTYLGEPPGHPPSHTFRVDIEGQSVQITIKPLEQYVERIVTLQQTREILPTASLIVRAPSIMPVIWYHELASRICKLISVAAGTVVEWIAADGFDPEISKHYRFHNARVTKAFCSLPAVPIKELSYQMNTKTLGSFLQAGLGRFAQGDARTINGVIAGFLDARLEGDYLETRGIKTAVTLEVIKDLFVDRFIREQWDSVMPDAVRKRLVRVTTAALKADGLDQEAIKMATEALNQLSRPSLRRILLYMLDVLVLTVDKTVLDKVIAIRNRLVHTGQFISHSDRKRAKQLNLTDATEEFYVLLSFVDRLLILTLGHVGPYMDYSTSNAGGIQMAIHMGSDVSIAPRSDQSEEP